MKKQRSVLAVILSLIVILLPCSAFSEGSDGDDLEDELLRQIEGIDFSSWDEYFYDLSSFGIFDAGSVKELVFTVADEGGAGDPASFFDSVLLLFKAELKKASGAIALLCAYGFLTALSVIVPDDGIKRTVSAVLSASAVAAAVGMLLSLVSTAETALAETGSLAEKTAPIICASLTAVGSAASLSVFSPILTLLSDGVIMVSERIVMPIVILCGILSAVSVITEGERLDNAVSFLRKAIKWILGLVSTVYFGVVAVNGLTSAARDGVMIRTSKYALDKMVPVVGGMIGGTVDSVMGCALLIKNGIGTCAILLLVFLIVRPMIVLAAGSFIFRVSAAVCGAVSDKRVVKLYKGCAETATNLFACVAVSGSMFLLTILAVIASGGYAAGLW
ncbi:MAG: stage III sporulation protein AE [Clostridia bacterium]|nr:stage III sporulation protein AE [Clostridia bacterium]